MSCNRIILPGVVYNLIIGQDVRHKKTGEIGVVITLIDNNCCLVRFSPFPEEYITPICDIEII